jgi:peptidoglycan/xylan/chitin deacetylase (PgdA/CDA1 family)
MKKVPVISIWDDGLESDLKLIEILLKHNAFASFAICPSLHKTGRVANDARSTEYGKKVSLKELREFSPFEILNHSDTHKDLTALDYEDSKKEIEDGKNRLEDMFSTLIDGFVYPYGCGNKHCARILSETRHVFARTTRGWPKDDLIYHNSDPYLLHPTCKWNYPQLLSLIEKAKLCNGTIIFWGHTYEFKAIDDWDQITELYKMLSQNQDVSMKPASDLFRVKYV